MKKVPESNHPDLGFQIAPMLDVVFVILLYFMVMSSSVKMEYEIKTTLPGSAETSTAAADAEMPEEVTIGINEAGEVSINDEPIAMPNDKRLDNLYAEMKKLGEAASQSGLKIIVTVEAESTVRYERIMNVLDILAKARVSNVTFSASDEEEM